MKNKQTYLFRASIALVLFMILGYTVKFYPENLTVFDESIQTTVRGSLPSSATSFFSTVTVLGNTLTFVFVLVFVVALLYFVKKWKTEGIFLGGTGVTAGLLIVSVKYLYGRQRPSIEHLVSAAGFSFPSGHSMGSMMIYGFMLIIAHQRIKSKGLRVLVETLIVLLIALIGLSRIYVGVHYPTDVLGGFILGFACLNLIFPFYDQKRFEARFQGKQK
ncbi:phosphatase PAP2 family protein [Streptococcus thoraltensis]|uniref:phosphatase PAP2 family protein n=1 Tax=Streptococcus thoraltensis TaxID=55085 RepID=UPI00037B3FEE|nr:phosphatase PAP2 family protein [Streptococcus thoraltensis]MDY4761362.1 phosphatase PAP2 family protein [Streptococcus thoraltensis]